MWPSRAELIRREVTTVRLHHGNGVADKETDEIWLTLHMVAGEVVRVEPHARSAAVGFVPLSRFFDRILHVVR